MCVISPQPYVRAFTRALTASAGEISLFSRSPWLVYLVGLSCPAQVYRAGAVGYALRFMLSIFKTLNNRNRNKQRYGRLAVSLQFRWFAEGGREKARR